VVDGRDKETEELTLTLTRREFKELIDTLKKAEALSGEARQNELDFRMQRMRFERKLRESTPPTPATKAALERADTTYISLEELHKLQRETQG
jgi:hypothetical protein